MGRDSANTMCTHKGHAFLMSAVEDDSGLGAQIDKHAIHWQVELQTFAGAN